MHTGSARLLWLPLAALVALSLGACRFGNGTIYRCEQGDRCQPGYECIDRYCWPKEDGGDEVDAGLDGGEDASTDAGPDDGGEDGGEEDGGTESTDGGDGGEQDSGVPLGIPLTWVMLHPLTELNTQNNERAPTVTRDQLTLCYQSDESEAGDNDVFCATRADRDAGFGTPVRQPLSQDGIHEHNPELSDDGSELFYSSVNAGMAEDIFRAVRDVDGTYEGAELQTPLVDDGYDVAPSLGNGGLTMFFQSDRTVGNAADIWVASRPDTSSPWGSELRLLAEVAATEGDREPGISPRGDYLLFTSERDAGQGVTGPLIYLSERLEDGGYGPGRAVWIEGVDASVWGVELAADETLYFSAREGSNGFQLYVARPRYDAGP